MKILHSGSLDVNSGGPALSTYLTMRGLRSCGIEAEMLMPPLQQGGKLIADDVTVHYTQPITFARFGYMSGVKDLLRDLKGYDLYHVQGLWQYLGHSVATHARKVGIPYVLTLRGMLYPQALAHSAFVKKMVLALYQSRDLKGAACIQVTCVEEMEHYRNLGYRNPVAVIPNAIDITGVVDRPIPEKDRLRIGYLGRVHPRKRIERLIYAFADLREQLTDAELVIIGSGDDSYEQFLRREVDRLGLKNVIFKGFLSGTAKDEEVMGLSLLVVPSDFENFGMIVSEALVRGVPVITSKGTPWQIMEEYECGWWVPNDQETINRTILEAISVSAEQRLQMGMNGKRLVRERFSVEALGVSMAQLYRWVLGSIERPGFVYID